MSAEPINVKQELDVRGAKCPIPIIKARQEINRIPVGEVLRVIATDPGSVNDFKGWAQTAKNIELVRQEESTDSSGQRLFIHYLRRLA
ncbi:MAG: sulfurtransferase TusA family protein [Gemmatales bacterium]|nr:sulfurtransferase TusA family protein [Gemmatales bacterium]MCS7161444.1 sulfurtransferase TusA family protein [Gemmatales bacterium]MDW8176647.1 sulfurtransferase TusA family protein [Gemmatales bacterium]MDW8223362.1 sulfurtransferase TusA family protein [Gemmatales bacterium]